MVLRVARLEGPADTERFEPESAGDRLTPDPRDNRYCSIDELRAYRLSERYQTAGTAVGLLQYHEQPPPALPRRDPLARSNSAGL